MKNGEKYVRNGDKKLTLTVDDQLKAWLYYQKLLNVKYNAQIYIFPQNAAIMREEAPVEEPAIKITPEMVSKAISKVKSG